MLISDQVCFNNIFANGIMLNSTGFKLFWNINELMFPRLAIRVPKKEISGAVERNRVKRLLREVFRDRVNAIPIFDYVIICKHRLLTCSPEKIRTSLFMMLNEIPPNNL
jgi:ribonuclease P protein component